MGVLSWSWGCCSSEGHSCSESPMEWYWKLPQTRQTCVRNMECHSWHYAFEVLSVFGSTYICKQIFSSMSYIKSKHRSCFTDDSLQSCVKVKVTSYSPDKDKLCNEGILENILKDCVRQIAKILYKTQMYSKCYAAVQMILFWGFHCDNFLYVNMCLMQTNG